MMANMERMTITLPRELMQSLKRIAAERQISLAALIRERVDEALLADGEPIEDDVEVESEEKPQ